MAKAVNSPRATGGTSTSMVVHTRLTRSWRTFRGLVDPKKFEGRYRGAIAQATQINASILLREVRANILTGRYAHGRAPNADLTVLIKGKDHPLVDRKKMGKFFSMKAIAFDTVEVGVADQKNAAQVAALHDGANIRVTPGMRAMFDLLASVSEGKIPSNVLSGRAAELYARFQGPWYRLHDNTAYIRIPPRPFFKEVAEARSIKLVMEHNWRVALEHAVIGFPVNYSTFRHSP